MFDMVQVGVSRPFFFGLEKVAHNSRFPVGYLKAKEGATA
jgi:hypothetical protein